jgi:signal transduction histidine kinase
MAPVSAASATATTESARTGHRSTGLRDSRRHTGRAIPGGEPAAPLRPLELQDRFAACVAHELRAPVARQRALAEVTLADPDADAITLRKMGERVVASCEQQQRLIEALLLLTRSRCGPRRWEPVDLAEIAAEALRTHARRGLTSVATLEPAQATGDPDLIERVAANLVSNAIRHNVPGGRIEITTGTDSGRAIFRIANTGPLIPAGDFQRLFQPFQRLRSHAGRSADGVGLGLAIVHAIADAHDATVTARARTGGGLRIDVAFPALD